MDQKQARNIDPASEEITDSARQSFQMLADRTVSLQESNLRLTQTFFQNFMQQLQSQTQENPQEMENLWRQGQQQREALESLSQEATNAYSDFLDSALSFYQETLNTASQVAQNNMQQAVQVPEIADYELRRELLRADKSRSVAVLDQYKVSMGYVPLTTEALLLAAQFWATVRQQGNPTAPDLALDADVILAAQAELLRSGGDDVVVATTNVGHLSRFVPAQAWQDVGVT